MKLLNLLITFNDKLTDSIKTDENGTMYFNLMCVELDEPIKNGADYLIEVTRTPADVEAGNPSVVVGAAKSFTV